MTKKIIAWREIYPEHKEIINKIAPDDEVVSSVKEVEDISDIEILYSWDKEEGTELLNNPSHQVKWLQTASAGVDYLDLDLLENQGVMLTNSSGIHAYGIAESIFGMLLSYTRGIQKAVIAQEKKEWLDRESLIELNEKTIMIVGTGKIGQQTGKLAKAFGMNTIGINRSGSHVEYMDEQYTQEDFSNHLHKADIIVNILPMTEATENLFEKKLFEKMDKKPIFINVGRGGTVKTEDLLEALDKGLVSFAALDVFHVEPLPEDHSLWSRDDVLITPHFSGMLEDYDKSLFPVFEENLKAFVENGELPLNLVDYSAGY